MTCIDTLHDYRRLVRSSKELMSESDTTEEPIDPTTGRPLPPDEGSANLFRQTNRTLLSNHRDAIRNQYNAAYAPISGLSFFCQSELENLLEQDDIVD